MAMWLAVAVFAGAYVLIATERVHRVAAALGGAGIVVAAGILDAHALFYDEATAIDWNVIFLLFGMMVIVGVLRHTGSSSTSRSGPPSGRGVTRTWSWFCWW